MDNLRAKWDNNRIMNNTIPTLRAEQIFKDRAADGHGVAVGGLHGVSREAGFMGAPEIAVLGQLRQEAALVMSVESSTRVNRIEGVNRFRRSGCRDCVRQCGHVIARRRNCPDTSGPWNGSSAAAVRWNWIGGRFYATPFPTRGLAIPGSSRLRDNEIIEIKPSGDRVVRFVPTPAKETPGVVDAWCTAYGELNAGGNAPPLLLIATAVFDFLCIHPFRDGNGRVSRLLTTMLLRQQGYNVSRYVSLEKLVEESREDYYRVLGECSRGWAEGKNEIVPWWVFSTIWRTYVLFEENMEKAGRARTRRRGAAGGAGTRGAVHAGGCGGGCAGDECGSGQRRCWHGDAG